MSSIDKGWGREPMRIFDDPEKRREAILTTPNMTRQLMINNHAGAFSLAVEDGYELEDVINKFMRSEVAVTMDDELNHYQWEGAESVYYDFIFECAMNDILLKKAPNNKGYDSDMAFWIGYIYRLTYFKTGEDSKDILEFMPAKTMMYAYPTGHCEDPDGWIEDYYLDNDLGRYFKYFGKKEYEAEH